MARRPSTTLTEAEQRLMEVVWRKGQATVADVVEALPEPSRPAYNTVMTTLRILEKKGYLQHTKSGRAFVYSPRVDRALARRRALRDLLRRFFDGSSEKLALNLMDEELDDAELRRLRDELERRS